jgi:hypothetical protein
VKKVMLVVVVLAFAAVVALPAFAEDGTTGGQSWFAERFAAKQAAIDEAVQDGRLTTAQAEFRSSNLAQMYRIHAENDFVCPAGGPMMVKQGTGIGAGGERLMGQGKGARQGNGSFRR